MLRCESARCALAPSGGGAKTLSGTCKPDKTNNLMNFDINPELFYYDSTNKCTDVSIMLDASDVPEFVKNHAGAGNYNSLNLE